MYSLADVKDECAKCENVLECELCRVGHGIKCERDRITELVICQMQHEEKRVNRDA